MKTEDILHKLLSFIDHLIQTVSFLLCLLFLLLGLYSLSDTLSLYQSASDSSILRFRPEAKKQTGSAYEQLKGSVSWLTLTDAGVDDPVMQGEDNLEYLNRNPYGEFSLAGSLFLDSRNSPDFSDPYCLIYGHHMEHHMMFGALDQYMEKEFFDTHPSGILYVKDQIYDLEIIAYAECSAYEKSVFEPGESSSVREFIKTRSTYLRECTLDENSHILCMSTCRFPDTQSRTVVFALIKDQKRSSV